MSKLCTLQTPLNRIFILVLDCVVLKNTEQFKVQQRGLINKVHNREIESMISRIQNSDHIIYGLLLDNFLSLKQQPSTSCSPKTQEICDFRALNKQHVMTYFPHSLPLLSCLFSLWKKHQQNVTAVVVNWHYYFFVKSVNKMDCTRRNMICSRFKI